jgi:lipopolysaccharide/colanic/teichoic acid biosynthesis glycosyltransferase
MPQRREWRSLQVAVACVDAGAIALTYVVAFVVFPSIPGAASPVPPHVPPALVLGVYATGWWALLVICRLYEPEHLLDGVEQYSRVVQASAISLLLLGFVAFLSDRSITWPWLVSSWLLGIFSFGLDRFLIRRVAWYLRRRGHFQARILIIGAGEDGLSIAEQISGYAKEAGHVVGYLDEYRPVGSEVAGIRILGEPLALGHAARQTNATDAIIVPQAISWESLQTLLQGGAAQWGVPRLWLAPSFRNLLTTGMDVHLCGSLPLLSVTGPRIIGPERALKRSLDVCLVLALLPIALPLCVGIAAWLAGIRHVAPLALYPIIGRHQRRSALITFASVPALQHTHLWRLPTLLNVLWGDLTLIGPQPIAASLEAAYRPWLVMLTSVRPGLVGPWWHLSASDRESAPNSVPAEVDVDLFYIRHYTIWFDLRLFASLVRHLITGKGGTWRAPQAATRGLVSEGAAWPVSITTGEHT